MQSISLNSHVLQQVCKQGELPTGIIITFQVMAVSGMSAGDPDAIGPVHKSGQDELGG